MRFSNTLVILCSATSAAALALPQAPAVAVPSTNLKRDNILATLGLAQLSTELNRLNTTISCLNNANLQSQSSGLLGSVTNLLGLTSTLNNILNTVVAPILLGLSPNGGVQSAYANVLNQLNKLNAGGGTLTTDQANQVTSFLNTYQANLAQLMSLLQAKLNDFNALSSGSLSGNAQNTLNGLLGGANAGTVTDRVRAFIQQTNINNANVLGGVTSLVSRIAPNLQATLQNLTNVLQVLINVTVKVYGLNSLN